MPLRTPDEHLRDDMNSMVLPQALWCDQAFSFLEL
jgi:hypothetical protein